MNSTLEYLHSLTNFESNLHKVSPDDFHLERVKELLKAVGDPGLNMKIIHAAGTKGKGSTCAMIASILQHQGVKVGLYTSPHLHRLNERIRILDKTNLHSADEFAGCITDERLAQIVHDIHPAIATIENRGWVLTFFEVLTVIAAIYFQQEGVQIAVLETGLGGRLDATNAFDSQFVVLTPISLDHTKILGDTLEKIAIEKAGIIKRTRQKVVIAPQPKKVMEVLNRRCKEFGIEPVIVQPSQYRHLKLSLKGQHQIINASCAAAVIQLLSQEGVKISGENFEEGLRCVRWQGRFEEIRTNPLVVVDGAHNPAASEVLAKTILDEYPSRRVVLVLGTSADKDIAGVCEPLKLISDCIILTKSKHPRSYTFSRQEAHDIFNSKEWFLTENTEDALSLAFSKAQKEDVIVVTGSLFIVAEVRELLKKRG